MTDAVREREAFEASFPIPGSIKCRDGDTYSVRDGYEESYSAERYLGLWEGWKARAALSEQPCEPDMRHPKIQALIGSRARLSIELSLVEQLLDDPDCDLTALDMEYWNGLHDKLRARLTAAHPAPVERVMQSEMARLVDKSNAYIIDNARLSDALEEMRDAHIKERESLRMMLSDALSALEYHQEQTRPIHSTKVAIDMIRRGIA